jgi:hypothetical protein
MAMPHVLSLFRAPKKRLPMEELVIRREDRIEKIT